jgi:hypothetical protein
MTKINQPLISFHVTTVEKVERRYSVTLVREHSEGFDSLKERAQEEVQSGKHLEFTEGNAEIEEVISVEEIT